MKSLSRAEDVKSSKKAIEREESHFLKIPDAKTPWYLQSLDYADGFVHWYEVGGTRRRVVCAGGIEGKGFAADDCPICALVLEMYQEAKEWDNEGNEAKAKKIKQAANDLHAKAEFQFKAIRGNRLLIKTKTGKEWVADWDADDEDSNAEAGVLGMSEAQFRGLTEMIGGEATPFIESGDDLGNRVLWSAKEKRKGKTGGKYSAVVWTADEDPSELPEFEIPEAVEEMDLEESFEIDLEEIDKVVALTTGAESEEVDEDESVEMEDADESTDEEDEPDDSDLDDIEDDDEVYEGEGEESEEFEDDLPYEAEEEEPEPEPVKKKVAKKPVAKKPAAKKPVKKTGLKPTTYKGSSKVRL